MKNALCAISFILISEAAGLIGSYFTASAITEWYAWLNKPSFSPPNWIFAPVWICLYALMGMAAYFVWRKRKESPLAVIALRLFYIHLAANALWSILFFGLRNPGAAFFEIIVLWLMIAALIILFYRSSKRAAWLMLPYLAWVSFAALLNYYIWILN